MSDPRDRSQWESTDINVDASSGMHIARTVEGITGTVREFADG